MKALYFIRHGRPLNDDGSFRMSGFQRDMLTTMDEPLSAVGKDQARRVAEFLRNEQCELVISSDMLRAAETADIIAEVAGIPRGDRLPTLRELAPGRMAGVEQSLPVRFLMAPFWPRVLARPLRKLMGAILSVVYLWQWRAGRTEGGEAFPEFMARLEQSRQRIAQLPAQRIAVVGHGFWIMLMALIVKGRSRWHALRLGWVDNCSVTRVDTDQVGTARLRYFGRKP